MSLMDLPKSVLRRGYHALLRGGLLHTQSDRSQARLRRAFERFHAMAGLDGIRQVQFTSRQCVIVLSDDRQYIYDPVIPAGRLYSIPTTGSFESKETEYVRRNLNRGDVCIDAGACFGWYTVLFSKLVGGTGAVHAFEPVESSYELLIRNVGLNGATNVKCSCAAIAEQRGQAALFVSDIGVSGSMRLHEFRRTFRRLQCDTISLDEYVAQKGLTRLTFIKADIEGGEYGLLRGAQDTLQRFRPSLILEIQEHSTRLFGHLPEDVFGMLDRFGYRSFTIGSDARPVEFSATRRPLPDHNFLFVHGERTHTRPC